MSGYLNFNFPKSRFVAENTLGKQIDHILSEVEEVREAFEISNEAVEEELADLTHSLETFWRKMQLERGEEYVEALFDRVEEKNRVRGYYGR